MVESTCHREEQAQRGDDSKQKHRDDQISPRRSELLGNRNGERVCKTLVRFHVGIDLVVEDRGEVEVGNHKLILRCEDWNHDVPRATGQLDDVIFSGGIDRKVRQEIVTEPNVCRNGSARVTDNDAVSVKLKSSLGICRVWMRDVSGGVAVVGNEAGSAKPLVDPRAKNYTENNECE